MTTTEDKDLHCPHCGRNDHLAVRETFTHYIDPEDGTAVRDLTTDSYDEVWCVHCERSLRDVYHVEYPDDNYIVARNDEEE